jgi:hypothetical protein
MFCLTLSGIRLSVYAPRHRTAWLEKLWEAGVRRRAEQLYQQLDVLVQIRRETRGELLAESRKHPASRLLQQIPYRFRSTSHQ